MSSVFYEGGLRFTCTRCSKCCRHDPGFVFLSRVDLQRLASSLGLGDTTFIERFCRRVSIGGFTRITLREKENYDCVFWEESGCTVYENRPLQCRAYPFWAQNLTDPAAWEAMKSECPGVDIGKLHTRSEIDAWLEARLRDPLLS